MDKYDSEKESSLVEKNLMPYKSGRNLERSRCAQGDPSGRIFLSYQKAANSTPFPRYIKVSCYERKGLS